ncbi:MAG: chorismate synthase [Chloroflexota bacterium]|nr:chorismate synthase [Chloroflexota bacterium]
MSLRLLTAGESHGPALTAILDGMPAGLPLDASVIDRELARRQKGFGAGGRMKIEKDKVRILGGLMGGHTTGGPLALMAENADHKNWQGKAVDPMSAPRPGHADLTGAVKYGYRDLRPALERSSARETTMRVAAGAVCKHFLAQFGIRVGGYVRSIGGVTADVLGRDLWELYEAAEDDDQRCPEPQAAGAIRKEIEAAIESGDSLGGQIEVFALGLPAGLGSFVQWDRRLEARLALALMSVQAIKGFEVGDGFAISRLPGTRAHDDIELDGEDLRRASNRAGGIEGGISNGQPLLLRVAMKPIATTISPHKTVDLADGKTGPTRYERSDYCPVPRAVPVLEAMLALALADALIEKLGGDSLAEMQPRFAALRKVRLADLPMDNQPVVWWE